MLLQLYLLRADAAGPEWLLASTLRESSQHEVIIPALEAALSDPSTNVPSTLPKLLADLHARKDLGVLPPYPTDDAKKPERNAKAKRRSELQEKYFEQANALLMASIPKNAHCSKRFRNVLKELPKLFHGKRLRSRCLSKLSFTPTRLMGLC